jgi:hypothetical protein
MAGRTVDFMALSTVQRLLVITQSRLFWRPAYVSGLVMKPLYSKIPILCLDNPVFNVGRTGPVDRP